MKIGILTQPLHNNYGGLLQAYALQHYLKQQGHIAITIDFKKTYKPKLWGIKGITINFIRKYILKQNISSILPLNEKKISQHTEKFISKNIERTQEITNPNQLKILSQYNFDAYIVGSDQVWRPAYSPGISAFFLDFLGNDTTTKRIAYAASFGINNCDEFSTEELATYSLLAKKFDAIGVREDSAVDLCDTHLRIKAEQVLDPTLLLSQNDYYNLITDAPPSPFTSDIMIYVLDKSEEKNKIINHITQEIKLEPYDFLENNIDNIYASVSKWLKGFYDSKFVITDSFHGVVFSIIFNKPFIAIGNKDRGLTRFTSLLKLFGLENRLILSLKDINANIVKDPIDYSKVNKILYAEQKKSIDFLQKALSDK
ncbi:MULTISPECIES: polysaccharide pyruvyl transferase family protein [Providencia]|uniref:polysaccharide pyruvyl transferase family protein n=1 Tax=Providencia TaxID=586 RepID=UPI0012B576EA|nr:MULTISPECIES: polysaccharide pyruvyl transferase family protein [Providencia]EMF0918944.1 polysaccharide pyruvyl transferase family protein [Providencia stuartii]MTC20403.1 polysaccharide pyruvyl transferase family protein [Providencia stuartii]